MRIILMSAMAALLAGCQAVQGYPPPVMSRLDALKSVQPQSAVGAEDAYDNAEGNEAQRRLLRNKIVRARMYVVDVNYNEFARSLSTEQKAFAVGSDIAVLALAGAGTIAKSTRTKTRLAAWSAGVLGGREAIDKEVYYDKTLPAITAQMEASRRTVYATLVTGLAKPDVDYPLLQAKADLESYYNAGTIAGALSAITKEAGKQADAADQKIERVNDAKYSYSDASGKIRAYWKPDGTTVDEAHADALDTWLGANAGGMSIGGFLTAPDEAKKAALIAALKIK